MRIACAIAQHGILFPGIIRRGERTVVVLCLGRGQQVPVRGGR